MRKLNVYLSIIFMYLKFNRLIMKQIIFIIIMSFAYNNISAQVYSYPIKPGTEA